MRPVDNFDLVLFGSQVQSWKGSLVPASNANLQAAQDFVRRFSLAGATNLNGGLLRGIEILNKAQGSHPELSSPASILIMLTDGEPTEGERLRDCPGRSDLLSSRNDQADMEIHLLERPLGQKVKCWSENCSDHKVRGSSEVHLCPVSW